MGVEGLKANLPEAQITANAGAAIGRSEARAKGIEAGALATAADRTGAATDARAARPREGLVTGGADGKAAVAALAGLTDRSRGARAAGAPTAIRTAGVGGGALRDTGRRRRGQWRERRPVPL